MWRHRQPLHFTGGRADRQTAVCSQEGTLGWGASRPCVDSWLDGFGPLSEKGKGQVLVGSSVGCEQRACREGAGTLSCAPAGIAISGARPDGASDPPVRAEDLV